MSCLGISCAYVARLNLFEVTVYTRNFAYLTLIEVNGLFADGARLNLRVITSWISMSAE